MHSKASDTPRPDAPSGFSLDPRWTSPLAFHVACCIGLWIAVMFYDLRSDQLKWVLPVHYPDKYMHFLLYGTLGWLAHRAFHAPYWYWEACPLPIPVAPLAVALLSVLDELTNMLLPQRRWDVDDLTANFLGLLCCFALLETLFWLGVLASRRLAAAVPGDAPLDRGLQPVSETDAA